MLLLSQQQHEEAIASLQRYLDRQQDAPDAGVIRRLIEQVRARYGIDQAGDERPS
jgi:poly(3-hydroxybutyrate) depolymerase